MGDRFLGPNLTDFFQLLAVIIRQYDVVRPFQAVTGNMISEYNEGLIQFSKKEWNLLLALDKNQDFLFFSRLISNCVDIKLTAQVLRHFCHENPEAGQNIISSLYRTVAQSKDTSRNSFAFALKSLIELEDSICLTRRLYILDLVLKVKLLTLFYPNLKVLS
jgi:hypothetical protein